MSIRCRAVRVDGSEMSILGARGEKRNNNKRKRKNKTKHRLICVLSVIKFSSY